MAKKPIVIAVTGHRLNQLPEAERPRIARDVARCVEQIGEAAAESFGAHQPIALASGVAEGADRYAADAALKLGWALWTPLPFSIDRFEKDFSDQASIDAFHGYLKRADRVWSMTEEQAAAAGGGDAAPYAAVARELARIAHVVIAVWSGKPPAGPGGTAEVGAFALQVGTPVLWTPTQASHAPRLIWPKPLPKKGSVKRLFCEALALRYDRIEKPEALRPADR
jgi:metal-dependent amidase/aminoacylase/carboxypeptidase family protein